MKPQREEAVYEPSLEPERFLSSWTCGLQSRDSNFLLFISQLAYGFLLQQLGKDPEAPCAAAVSLLPLRLEAHGRHLAPGSAFQASHFPKLPFPNPITFCASALPGRMQPGPG